MTKKPIQIRIDPNLKDKASELFSMLGLDMSGAITLFLHQCVLRGGLPFPVELPQFSEETLEAIAEARQISRDPNVKGYQSMEELIAALEE